MAHVQLVRAKLPRRRAVRARVGVLEDVRGSAGEDLSRRAGAMNRSWERFIAAPHHEDALSVQRPICLCCGASAHQRRSILVVQTNLAITYPRAWTA